MMLVFLDGPDENRIIWLYDQFRGKPIRPEKFIAVDDGPVYELLEVDTESAAYRLKSPRPEWSDVPPCEL